MPPVNCRLSATEHATKQHSGSADTITLRGLLLIKVRYKTYKPVRVFCFCDTAWCQSASRVSLGVLTVDVTVSVGATDTDATVRLYCNTASS